MNRLFKSTIFTLMIFISVDLAAQSTCKVNGKIKGIPSNSEAYVTRRVGEYGQDTVAKAQIVNGQFALEIKDKDLNEIYELRVKGNRGSVSFVAEKGVININGVLTDLYHAEISGTEQNKMWSDYQKYIWKLADKRDNIAVNKDSQEVNKVTNTDDRKKMFKMIDAEMQKYRDSLIRNHSNTVVALFIAKMPLMMMKYNQIDSVLSFFTPYYQNHPYYQEMKKRADVIRKVAPSVPAPDFSVMKPDGSKITLSDFKGKYVLLDFWASWCVPCRAENAHTKEIFNKYHDKGLEVISFSLDSDKDAWVKAINKDGLVWNNASDLTGGKLSKVAQIYGIDGIPAIWIIDPKGMILAEGLRGQALDEFCSKLFSK